MKWMFRTVVAIVLVGAAFVGGRTYAQNRPGQLGGLGVLQNPTILSGGDIGFRVDRQRGDVPVGVLGVRVNGRWVEPEYSRVAKPLDDR